MQILNPNLLLAALILFVQQAAPPTPLIRENATVKVSEHVYVIPDGNVGGVPNVGIVVGSKATLVIDTGLGPKNGQTVLREVQKVSKNADIYIVATHFHSEHTLGEAAFPASAKLIRARAQQQDIDEFGIQPNFGTRSPAMAELMKDAQFRRADEFFDNFIQNLLLIRIRRARIDDDHLIAADDETVGVRGRRQGVGLHGEEEDAGEEFNSQDQPSLSFRHSRQRR